MQRMPAKWELGCLADLTHVDKKGTQSFHHTNCFMSLQISKNLFSYSQRFIGGERDGTLPTRINLRTGSGRSLGCSAFLQSLPLCKPVDAHPGAGNDYMFVLFCN